MARHPDWFERLDAILDITRQSTAECLGRKEMKAVFGCGERDSIRLLHKFGAQEIADALSLPRFSLLTQLEALQSGTAYSAFLRQRRQVAKHLAAAQAENAARRRRIPGSAEFQAGKSLADLPAGVRLEPGRVVCEFAYPEDFWAMIDALADGRAERGVGTGVGPFQREGLSGAAALGGGAIRLALDGPEEGSNSPRHVPETPATAECLL